MTAVALAVAASLLAVSPAHSDQDRGAAPGRWRTVVSISGSTWHIDQRVTYPGARAEGLLMNVRMVNSVFEDRNRLGWQREADENTGEFIARIRSYVASGVRAFTVCLQGGTPGYEGAQNSAFEPDGALRPEYMARVRRVIEECDRRGAVVILGCFYQRQDQVLRDEAAVRAGVANVCRWLRGLGARNVVLEIANEYGHGGYDHPILKTPEGQTALIDLAHDTAPGLLVSTSGLGDGAAHARVAEAADFILVHFNGTPADRFGARIDGLKRYGKPIVCNEDEKVGEVGAEACRICVEAGASWGLMLVEINQRHPFTFAGPRDDLVVYRQIEELTHPKRNR